MTSSAAPSGPRSHTVTSAGCRRRSTWPRERQLAEILVAGSRDGMLTAAHDVSDGGLAQTLAEMALRGDRRGAGVLPDGLDPFVALFWSPPGARCVVVPRSEELRFNDMCAARGVPGHPDRCCGLRDRDRRRACRGSSRRRSGRRFSAKSRSGRRFSAGPRPPPLSAGPRPAQPSTSMLSSRRVASLDALRAASEATPPSPVRLTIRVTPATRRPSPPLTEVRSPTSVGVHRAGRARREWRSREPASGRLITVGRIEGSLQQTGRRCGDVGTPG